FVFLMFPPAPADSSSLNCSIIRLPTCYLRYQLAQWTDSADCDSYWEDHNRVVIARGPSYNETLIETLTDGHIDLNICQHHLRHRTDCLEVKQTLPRRRIRDYEEKFKYECGLCCIGSNLLLHSVFPCFRLSGLLTAEVRSD
ncbi:hypothetical protein XENORESO_017448, partial [Xenotaenia resolanae]